MCSKLSIVLSLLAPYSTLEPRGTHALLIHKKDLPGTSTTHPPTNINHRANAHTCPSPSPSRLKVPAHVIPDPRVVEQALDAAHRADSDVLVPQLPVGKIHHVLLRHTVDDALDLAGTHPPACRDDLPPNVFRHRCGAVEGEQDRRLELRLCPLHLGLRHVAGESGPFPQREVDEIVDLAELVGDEVNAPETASDQ